MKIAGISEGALRLPSALAGSFSMVLVYFFARRFLGRAGSLAASALLAFSPLHVWYSQECRAYAIWLLLILCAYLSFFNWLDTRKPAFATLNGLFIFLATAFHYFGIHVFLIENLYLIHRRKYLNDHRSFRHWVICQTALALALVPIALMMLMVDRTHVAWWKESAVQWQVIKSILFHLTGTYYFLTYDWAIKTLLLLMNGAALMLGIFALRRRGQATFPMLAIMLPVALNLAYSLAISPILGNSQSAGRYFLLTLPPYLIIIAAGWEFLWRRYPRPRLCLLALAGLLALNGLGVRASHRNTVFNRDDNRRLIGELLRRAAPGDWIIASPAITLDYYADRSGYNLENYRIISTSRFDRDLTARLPSHAERVWLYLDPAHHFTGLRDEIGRRYGLMLLLDDQEKKLSGAGLFMFGRHEAQGNPRS